MLEAPRTSFRAALLQLSPNPCTQGFAKEQVRPNQAAAGHGDTETSYCPSRSKVVFLEKEKTQRGSLYSRAASLSAGKAPEDHQPSVCRTVKHGSTRNASNLGNQFIINTHVTVHKR